MHEIGLTVKVIFNAAVACLAMLLTYIGASQEPFWILVSLLAVDYITGIAKAYSIEENISSHKMKYGIVSKLMLVIIPLVLGLAAKALDTDGQALMLWGMNVLVISEAYSILGNIHAVTTGTELPEIDVIAKIGKRIRRFIGGEDELPRHGYQPGRFDRQQGYGRLDIDDGFDDGFDERNVDDYGNNDDFPGDEREDHY